MLEGVIFDVTERVHNEEMVKREAHVAYCGLKIITSLRSVSLIFSGGTSILLLLKNLA
jgi:hypothetical protein